MTQHVARIVLALVLTVFPVLEDLRAGDTSRLESLRKERKFAPTGAYTGPDTPEDGAKLIRLVNAAIGDVMAMQRPLVADVIRGRLQKLIDAVDLFATEDRYQAYIYTIRIWRAAGFTEDSKLFPVGDKRVLLGL
jgi:hypothetical protein